MNFIHDGHGRSFQRTIWSLRQKGEIKMKTILNLNTISYYVCDKYI